MMGVQTGGDSISHASICKKRRQHLSVLPPVGLYNT